MMLSLACLALLAAADEIPVIVGFHGEADATLLSRHGGRPLLRLESANAWAGRVPAERLRALRTSPGVAYVEEDVILSLSLDPDDTRYAADQKASFTLTNCQKAWDVTRGAGIRVAVLDTGVRMTHEDLGSGTSGKVKTWKNFTTTTTTDVSDGNGHGTHTSGIVGARTNNATGVASAGFDCELAMGKVLDANGTGNSSWTAAGLDWARLDSGAKVVSISLNGGGTNALRDAVNAAWNAGLIIVAAAGNNNSSSVDYPGAYPNCICVAACNNSGAKASFSNYGPAVDVAAPGVGILSTYNSSNSGYTSLSGTSMSTPHVAGIVALVWAMEPGASNAVIRNRIESTATQFVDMPDGAKVPIVNAYEAAISTAPLPSVGVAATDAAASEAGPDPGTFTFTRTGGTSGALTVSFSVGGTATSGSDYTSIGTSVTIPSGASTVTKTVNPVNDAAIEPDETVIVTVTAGALYTVGTPSSATVTIKDDDTPPPPPTVSVAATDADAAEPGSDSGTFAFTRSGSTAASLTVKYVVGGTALSGSDFTAIGTSVTIPAGAASVTKTLTVLDDTSIEGDETVSVTIATDPAYTIDAAAGAATVTIHDDDAPPAPSAAGGGGGHHKRCGMTGLEAILLLVLLQGLRSQARRP